MQVVATDHRVLGVLAGADMPVKELLAWVESSSLVLAADGGANRLVECGIVPHSTIGDLDSISPEAARAQVRLISIEDQDTSDCDKLLHLAQELGTDRLTLAGVEGDLLDHVIGTIHSAAKIEIKVQLALRRGLAWILKGPAEFSRFVEEGTRVSLLPISVCEEVFLTGTQWSLNAATLGPEGLTSLSNRASGGSVKVQFAKGVAVLFVETNGLPDWSSL